jgi:hypothetical protein
MKTQVLIESIHLDEAVVDRDNRAVAVTLIRPGWSANGRYYAPDVLAQAASLYENIQAFADHPSREQLRRGEGRSVRDVSGRYSDVHLGAGGELRATRHVFGQAGEAVWPLIVESVNSRTPVIGLSMNAIGRAGRGKAPDGREGVIVEAITAVNSVDDVTAPAAGGGFESLLMGQNDLTGDLLAALDYEEWIAVRPDLVERLKREWKQVRQTGAVVAANTERDRARQDLIETQGQVERLQEQLAAQETELAGLRGELARKGLEVELERALRNANLPAHWEDDLRAQLLDAEPGDWPDILAREQRKAQTAGVRPPKVPVRGAPQRVQRVVVTEGPQVGPVDMAVCDTPDKLAAYVRRRV